MWVMSINNIKKFTLFLTRYKCRVMKIRLNEDDKRHFSAVFPDIDTNCVKLFSIPLPHL